MLKTAILLVSLSWLGLEQMQAADSGSYVGPIGIMVKPGRTDLTVMTVEKGSPADGKLNPGDVIVGTAESNFQKDARPEIAAAIDLAESASKQGALDLVLKNKKTVSLKLETLGDYAGSAPWNCKKTDLIITQIADQMVKNKSYANGQIPIGWLGLMATGEEKYMEIVKRELPQQAWIQSDPKQLEALLLGDTDMGYIGWYWGYQMITMAEYHMLTGDKSVLPTLRNYALTMAKGQDPSGLWGHRLATVKRNGRLPGYSHINNPSLSTLIGMQLAMKCGIHDPEIKKAVAKSVAFYETFSGEGSLPYGVHDPNSKIFNNNGSSAMAAIVMALAGEKEAAVFFSRQAAAAHNIQETGHATHYFNVLWTPIGANVAGPAVSQAFFDRGNWVRTLYRSWNHRFTLNGGKQNSCNDDGSLLLAYCIPRAKLVITGREADPSLWVKADEVQEVIGASEIDYKSLNVDQLIGLFGHLAPQVTRNAQWELRSRQGDFIPKLVKLMESGTVTEKRTAIGFFGYQCPAEWALPQTERLGAILKNTSEHPRVRAAAADALSSHGEKAYVYYQDMLKFIMADEANDPFGILDKEIAMSMSRMLPDPFASKQVIDKKLYYQAALKLADHPRQNTRAVGMDMLQGMPPADFHLVADKVAHVLKNNDPKYHSYHNPMSSSQAAALILSNMEVKDGLEWAWDMINSEGGKFGFKGRALLGIMKNYGPSAKTYLDKIEADPKLQKSLSEGKFKGLYDEMVKAVNTGEAKPLKTLEEAKKTKQ